MNIRDIQIIARDLGLLILLISIALLIPVPLAIYYTEWSTIDDFVIAASIAAAIGSALYFPIKAQKEIRLKHSIALTVLFWPIASFFGAIPLYTTSEMYSGTVSLSFIDCYFDGMAGWTTTGLSILQEFADNMPNSVNIWRALMQFLGGLGIILISIVILSQARTGSESISRAATELTPTERIRPSMINTARSIFFLFLGFLLVSSVLLFIVGMSPFDAVFHGMTGLSTGGFSTHSDSIRYFDSVQIELATLVIMFMASTNFAVHISILSGNFREIIRNIESRTFIILLIVFSTIAALWIFNNGSVTSDVDAVRLGFYHVMSGLTNSGWTIESSSTLAIGWAPMVTFLLIICMLIGGSTSSASGGLRLARFALIFKSVWWNIKRALLPGSIVFPRTYHHIIKKTVTDRRMMDIYVFASVYIVTILASTLIIASYGHHLESSLFECTSAVSTTGMSSGLTSHDLQSGAKIILILDMWVGRIEIIPLLIFFASLSRKFR